MTADHASRAQVSAIRNLRNGKAHIDSGARVHWLGQVVPVAACGWQIENAEFVPWDSIEPAGRCGQCTRRRSVR